MVRLLGKTSLALGLAVVLSGPSVVHAQAKFRPQGIPNTPYQPQQANPYYPGTFNAGSAATGTTTNGTATSFTGSGIGTGTAVNPSSINQFLNSPYNPSGLNNAFNPAYLNPSINPQNTPVAAPVSTFNPTTNTATNTGTNQTTTNNGFVSPYFNWVPPPSYYNSPYANPLFTNPLNQVYFQLLQTAMANPSYYNNMYYQQMYQQMQGVNPALGNFNNMNGANQNPFANPQPNPVQQIPMINQ